MAKKTGTKEWAETSLNIARGCGHGCRYCYARYNLVDRFKLIAAIDWPVTTVQKKAVSARYGKLTGTVMFPTAHDIVPEILDDYCAVLSKLVAAGNAILIVTKPHLECIRRICRQFHADRKQILFRFTIGSQDSQVLKFWEPNAPTFEERMECLRMAFGFSFETSVSCEPFLDGDTPALYEACLPYVTESFWVGLLRHWGSRVRLGDATAAEMNQFVYPLLKLHSGDAVRSLVDTMNSLPLIQWKDSIKDLMEIPCSR